MAATAPNMGLKVWNLLTDPYDHAELASNWAKVDQHDHSAGKGVQIPTGGIADGAISAAKIGTEQITNEKFSTATGETGGFNTASRTYRKAIVTEETFTTSSTAYVLVDSTPIYVPSNGKLMVQYLAGYKVTTAAASIQLFIDNAEAKYVASSGAVTTFTPRSLSVIGVTSPVWTLAGTEPFSSVATSEYNPPTTGVLIPGNTLSFFGLPAGNHTVEIKVKAGASGTVSLLKRNLWARSEAYA